MQNLHSHPQSNQQRARLTLQLLPRQRPHNHLLRLRLLLRPHVSFKQDLKIKQTATVQKGDTIFSLARKYYKSDNRTIIDLILQANPGIKDSSIIKPAERVKIPEINESALILKSGDNDYLIHLATYANPAAAGIYQNEPLLKDYRVEVIPVYGCSPQGLLPHRGRAV